LIIGKNVNMRANIANSMKLKNNQVAVLIYDGLCAFEYACVTEVFAMARPEVGQPWYKFQTCAHSNGWLSSQYGLKVQADAGLDSLERAGTIIIPGWKGIEAVVPQPIINALLKAYKNGARLVSICSGVVVIAATGLLNGKRATTHWRYASALQALYPKVIVDCAVLYVDEGRLLTSAGSAAGLDLCLHLVRRDFGPKIANQVARRLVVPPHRDGGQAQFVERPMSTRTRDGLSGLMDNVQKNLSDDWPIAELANFAAMSERTLIRRFKATTGLAPAEWLTSIRVDRARELLESTKQSIDLIADSVGLGTASTLRHHFRKHLGTSPSAYRSRFSFKLREKRLMTA
jgi:AraC family transcriptional regulator, transcriptional activator FtrA